MKILMLTLGYPPQKGGIERAMYNLAKRLSDKNNVIVVSRYCSGCEKFDKKQNHKIIRVKNSRIFKFLSLIHPVFRFYAEFIKVLKEIKIFKPDIIFVGHIFLGFLAWRVFQKYQIPYALMVYGQEIDYPYFDKGGFLKKKIAELIFRNAKIIFTNSSFSKELVLNFVDEKRKIKKIPLGVDESVLKSKVLKKKCSYKFSILKGKKIILTVARFEPYKGMDFVIKAMPKVIEKYNEVVYVIAGYGEKKEKERLLNIAKRLGVDEKVVFYENLSDEELAYLYSICNLFILNSRDCRKKNEYCPEEGRVEGFGIVFLEAGAFGKPVIGGDSGGIRDAVIHNYNGLLVNPLDEEEIAKAILKILGNKKMAKKFGRNGKKRVKNVYNWDNSARIISKMLAKCLKKI